MGWPATSRPPYALLRKASEVKVEAEGLLLDVQATIREHQRVSASTRRSMGIGSTIYAATSPGADSKDKAEARRLLAGVSAADIDAALRDHVKALGGSARMHEPSGSLTAYGRRLARRRSFSW